MALTPLAQARPVAVLLETAYDLPEATDKGISCGGCSSRATGVVKHATVRHVEFCHYRRQEWAEEAKAEQEAEYRTERFFEDRGYDEARGQEAFERAMNVYDANVYDPQY